MKLAAFLISAMFCAPCAGSAQPLTPQAVFAAARATFRAHRSLPPYEIYTLRREQRTVEGMPDLDWTYEYRIWCRTSDSAAMGRRIFSGKPGALEFMRPAFDEARDPGPVTADLFQLSAPRVRVPAAAPNGIPLIGSVDAAYEAEYAPVSLSLAAGLYHLRVRPLRDPRRNRVRELWVDATTFAIRRAVVSDRLFILGGPVFEGTDTIEMSAVDGIPVITRVHSHTDFNVDSGDGLDVDYTYSAIAFARALPDWYFVPATYGDHIAQAPL